MSHWHHANCHIFIDILSKLNLKTFKYQYLMVEFDYIQFPLRNCHWNKFFGMVPSCCQCDCYLPFKNVFGPSNCARSIIWSNSFGDLEGTWLRYKKKVWELQKIALFQNKSMVRRATSKKMMSVWQYLNHKIMTKTDNKLIKFVSAFTIDNFFEGHHVSLHGQCL